jgi:hypothetical protein
MDEQININELGVDGLPIYDENGEKYDDALIMPEKRKTCGKPRQYEEGWREHYKSNGYYLEYNRRYAKVLVKCSYCGTMSNKTGVHQHQKTTKCKLLREKLANEL